MKKTTQSLPRNLTPAPILEPGRVVSVPIELLVPDPTQPRTHFDDTALEQLAAHITQRGIKTPLVVRGDYVIEDGERRWRAAKLAGLTHVPCVLAGVADSERPELQRAMDQVAQNHLREALNPMEWAKFFLRLRDQFGLTVEQIPYTLAAQGIAMSRPYVSNLMRLIQLPAWAQDKIAEGKLSAAHGKVLLTAVASKQVMDVVHKEIKKDTAITTDDLEAVIADAFHEEHLSLNATYGDHIPLFDTKQCNKCESCVTIKGRWNEGRYCINHHHFRELQEAARKAKEQKAQEKNPDAKKPTAKKAPAPPKQPVLDKNGVATITRKTYQTMRWLEDAAFDTDVCNGCEWNHPANYERGRIIAACFNVAEYERKQDEARRNRGRRERVADYLDAWVRAQIVPRLEIDKALQFKLLSYLAVGMPGSHWLPYQGNRLARAARVRHLKEHLAQIDRDGFPADKVLAAGLHELSRGELYHFARHVGVTLSPRTYQIDVAYVNLGKKADLCRLIKQIPEGAKVPPAPADTAKLDALAAYCLRPEVVQAVGVPRELTYLFETNDIDPNDYIDDVDEEDNDVDTDAQSE